MTGRVVVVGGGIAGLTAAYRLRAAGGPEVTVLEAEPVPGGKVRSVEVGGVELEAGPDSLIARKPWAVGLCRELGLGHNLVAPATDRTYVWTEAGLRRFPIGPFGIPAGLGELWGWAGMSRRGRLRALGDLVRKPEKGEGDRSLGSLLRRRLGDEATDALVAPLLGGLFAGDVDRLSAEATFPELAEWERRDGSLIRGARAAAKAAGPGSPSMFLRLEGGLGRLTGALAEAIGARLRCGTAVDVVEPDRGRYLVRAGRVEHSAGRTEHPADAVVMASPAFVAAGLVERLAPEAAMLLRQIPYASTAVVLLVYAEGTGDALPDATGFVVPAGKAPLTACTFVSRKWPRPELGSRAVLRCFVGGVGAEDVLDAPDREIAEAVCGHVAALVELPAAPEAWRVVRWLKAMPQYEVGHLERLARIEGSLPPGVFLAGSGYRGVGLPDCVRSGNEVAGRVLAHLAGLPAKDVEQERV
ncbi:MAG: protoporphyrinogen oxidase [Actinomycetota bacterium]